MNMDGNLKRNASENEKERILTRYPDRWIHDLQIFDHKSPIFTKHVTIQNKPNTMTIVKKKIFLQ